MQLKQYQSQELKDLLELKLKQNISEILALETKVDSWQKQRKEMLVIYRGKLVYGDSIIPNNQEFAKNLGDRLQPNLINAALTVATGKLNNPKSVRELMQILVKFRVFKWENIEAYIYDRVLAIIDKFNSYPGEVQWHDSEDFDLCFGQDGHGLNWTKLKQDLNNRQQQWASLVTIVPSMDAIPYISESSLEKVSHPKVKEHLKNYVNGEQTLVDIAKAMDKDPLKVATIYVDWVKSGWVSFKKISQIDRTKSIIYSDNNRQTKSLNKTSVRDLPIVLSVDDSPIVQISIKRALSGHYNVLFASQASEALSILNNNSIELLLLDLTMPDIDGLDFCKTIRKIPKFKDLPVIMVTARDGFVDKLKGQIAGTNKYITKPFQPEELLEIVNKYITIGST